MLQITMLSPLPYATADRQRSDTLHSQRESSDVGKKLTPAVTKLFSRTNKSLAGTSKTTDSITRAPMFRVIPAFG